MHNNVLKIITMTQIKKNTMVQSAQSLVGSAITLAVETYGAWGEEACILHSHVRSHPYKLQ